VPAHCNNNAKNVFAAARGDKTAMWPFAKLLWTFVITENKLITLSLSTKNAARAFYKVKEVKVWVDNGLFAV